MAAEQAEPETKLQEASQIHDDEFWQKLEQQNKIKFNSILKTIRDIDKKTHLTVGKYHDEKQKSGLLDYFMDTRKNEVTRDQLNWYTIMPNKKIALKLKQNLIDETAKHSTQIDRSVGCMIGMAIADAVGHPLEFIAITKQKECSFDYASNKYVNELNRFKLQRGQWTDDASMGLCMADSLIIQNEYDGSDIRIRFWNWWQNGYNNAFRNDKSRSASCGLGGNISSSIYSCKFGEIPSARFEVEHNKEDSGNGSLMRLAPIPIFYQFDADAARKYCQESSFTTHPGYIAAEACSFVGWLIVQCIHCKQARIEDVKSFLNERCEEYRQMLLSEMQQIATQSKSVKTQNEQKEQSEKVNENENENENKNEEANKQEENKKEDTDEDANKVEQILQRQYDAKALVVRLLESKEMKGSLEECWNWKLDTEQYRTALVDTFYNRSGGKDVDRFKRKKYNGYPVNADYFGSYCMDGLAMALHAVYHSVHFADAIEKCVNLLGDADSTGSIAGQIAGAIYGYTSVVNDKQQKYLFDQLVKWDDCNFAFSALLMYVLGNPDLRKLLL